MIAWLAAALVAYFVKGMTGFANTLVFSTLLSFGAPTAAITPVEALVGFPSNIIMAWREREAIQWNVCLPLAICVLLGSLPGIFLLKNASSQAVKIAFGAVIMLVGIEMLLRERTAQTLKPSLAALCAVGTFSGFLCGLYGIGAFTAAYLARVTKDSHAFKANMCFVGVVENVFRITLYVLTGILTAENAQRALLLLPAMLLGLWAGMKCASFLPEKLVKRMVDILLILSGAALIFNNL